MRFVLSLLTTSVLLAACGGSDDNGVVTPGTGDPSKNFLTTANYVGVAQAALQTNAYLLNLSDLVFGVQVIEPQMLVQLGQEPLRRLLRASQTAPQQALGVVEIEEEPCDGGGKQVFEYNDANNSGVLDAGDSITLNAQACSVGNAVINGQIKVALSSVSGDPEGYPFRVLGNISYNNLSLEVPGERISSSGNMSVDFSAPSEGVEDYLLRAPSFSLTTLAAGKTSTQTLQNYEISLKVRPASRQDQLFTSSVSGTLVASALDNQSLSVKTTQPFERLSNQQYANRGEVTVTDLSGAKVRATVTSATTVTIDLDADANGTYETSVNKLWSEIF